MQAYADGRLSSAEQYQVEKYLLDHPFEAEAMEGYLENPKAFDDLSHLNDRLEDRINSEKKKVIIPLWREVLPYAAVLLLLIISTVFTINFFQQDKSFAPIAIEAEDALPNEIDKNAINPPTATSSDPVAEKVEKLVSEVMPNKTKDSKEEDLEDAVDFMQEASPIASQQPITPDEDLLISEISDVKELEMNDDIVNQLQGKVAGVQVDNSKFQDRIVEKSSLVASEATPSVNINGTSRSKKQNVSSKPILASGEVQDAETGEPLPGVSVMIKGTAIGTTTDLEGNFQIAAGLDDILVISFIGMEKQEHLVKELNDIEIYLNSDVTQLSEVVVIGYGTEKVEEDVTYSGPRPVIGFTAYRDYLQENLQYPEEAQEAGTEGKVRLKLNINANGVIDDVEVLKSLGDGCDEEAIRLVEEGPKWQPAKKGNENVSSTRKITVRFKLD